MNLMSLIMNGTVEVMIKYWKNKLNILLYADDAVILVDTLEEIKMKTNTYRQ